MAKKQQSQNGMMDRAAFQKNENYPSQETGLPSSRFQEKAQTAVASETNTEGNAFITKGNSETPELTSIVARTATAVKKKMSIKPTSDTALEDGKIIGGVPLGESGATMSVAGAPVSLITGDQSRVPYTRGGARPADRYGKKISTDNFIINNVISEQIAPSFDEPKDLRESPDAVQGYNGRKQFKSARAKKNFGTHPASTLFERSIDFNAHSNVVHTTGQVIGIVPMESNYPVCDIEDPDARFNPQLDKGNYLFRGLELKTDGHHITDIKVIEDRFVTPSNFESQEQANMNWQVDSNNVAKALVKMQTELGRETTDKWSPLGYVIEQPYQYGMLFHDGEAICGALTGAAYKTAAHGLAFLQNKMAKEGIRNLSSIAEWMIEDLFNASDINAYNGLGNADLFNLSHNDVAKYTLRHGSAAAMISFFDSTAKYSTKADFINQPRSLKMHLQTVDNNINPFHAKKEFYKALDKVMYFSTEDGTYNPVLPVHVTDTIKVMTPYSLNAFLKNWSNPKLNPSPKYDLGENEFIGNHGQWYTETGLRDGLTYKYNDIRNIYEWTYVDPFIAGLCRWILRHEAKIVETYAGKDHEACTILLPFHVTNTTANLLSYIICSASQDIAWMRNLIFRDYLFAGDQGVYVWDDLASLSELNPLYSSQYTYSDYGTALKLGALSNVAKIRLNFPEVIQIREDANVKNTLATTPDKTPAISYYLPFYFNENMIDMETSCGVSPDEGCKMSFPLIRNGVNHEHVDVLYSMSERDLRLCLDRMVTLPTLNVITTEEGATREIVGTFPDKYGDPYVASALRYDTNSDGRVIITFKGSEYSEDKEYYVLQDVAYLTTPRELGYIFPLPENLRKPIINGIETLHINEETSDIANIYRYAFSRHIAGGTSDFITSYQAEGYNEGQIVSRSASLSQRWIRCFASSFVRDMNYQFVRTTGLVPALSCLFDVDYNVTEQEGVSKTTAVYSLVHPELYAIPCLYDIGGATVIPADGVANGGSAMRTANSVLSLAGAIWTMMQRMYAPINVFDAAFLEAEYAGTASYVDGIICDPLEMAMYFGFAGTLASDFTQDVLNRLDIKDQLGMFYFKDEFIKSSLIFN